MLFAINGNRFGLGQRGGASFGFDYQHCRLFELTLVAGHDAYIAGHGQYQGAWGPEAYGIDKQINQLRINRFPTLL